MVIGLRDGIGMAIRRWVVADCILLPQIVGEFERILITALGGCFGGPGYIG